MSGREKFERAIIAPTSAILRRILRDETEVTNKWVTSVLVGSQSSPQAQVRPLRRDDAFLMRLLKGFSEIDASLSALDTIAKLSRRGPQKGTGVDPGAQLKLLVETYLNEIYILSQRCRTYLTKVERSYRNDRRTAQIRRVLCNLATTVTTTLAPIINARGVHVHEERHDDFEIGRLSTLRILAPSDPIFDRIHRRALKDARRHKVKWMADNNREIHKLLDHYFAVVHDVVFDENDEPRFPGNGASGSAG